MWECIECEHENPRTLDKCEQCSTPRPTSSLVGEQISQWVIESELGEGGMAVVFQARHVMLGSPVAIKILRSELMHKREVVERFKTEALAASHLRHDNVIQVHDFGTQKGVGVYMVLEFLEGNDLEEQLEDHGAQDLGWSLAIAKQVCSGLEAAHNAKIIHRDLKPSNIYLVPRNDNEIPMAKILDFGIAKIQESHLIEGGDQNLTRTGTVLGTPYYLSPEQLRRRDKQELGPSVDIYAFGVILYQMLTGVLPIEEPTLAEQMAAILTKTPRLAGEVREDLSGTALELLLARLLSKNPADRPSTIAEVWEELEKAAGALNDPTVDAALRKQWKASYKTPELSDIVQPESFFQRFGVTLLLVALLLGGGGTLGYVLMNPGDTPPKKQIDRRPPPRIAMPKWQDLQNKASNAYKNGNYTDAIKLWRLSLQRLRKQAKKGGAADKGVLAKKQVEILRSIGIASGSANRNYAAYHTFQKLSKAPNLSPEDKQNLASNMAGLQQKITQERKDLQLVKGTLSNLFKAKAYKVAHQNFARLELSGKDKSMPDKPKAAGDLLSKILPALALGYYNQALKLSMTAKDKAAVQKQRQPLLAKVQARRDALKALLGPNLRRSSRVWRKVQKLLDQQGDDRVIHRAIIRRIQQLLTTDPATAIWMLRNYKKSLQRLRKSKIWPWINDALGKELPTDKQLTQLLSLARKDRSALRSASRSQKQVQRQVKRGNMAKALDTRYKLQASLEAFWLKAANLDGPLKAQAQAKLKQIRARKEQTRKLNALWSTIKKSHQEDRLAQSAQDLETLLGLVKGSPLEAGFQKTHDKWKKQHAKGAQYRAKGDKYAKRRAWLACKQQFDYYLRIFPKSQHKETIKLKRCKCRCKLPAPFEPCSEQCKLPYK